MKTKRPIIVGILVVLSVGYVISIIPNFRQRAEWNQTVASLQSLSHERVATAARAFARERKTTESDVPLRELVSGGYLRTEDIRGLADRDATVYLSTNDTTPNLIWIRVRASDGSDIVRLADGSVQRMARQ